MLFAGVTSIDATAIEGLLEINRILEKNGIQVQYSSSNRKLIYVNKSNWWKKFNWFMFVFQYYIDVASKPKARGYGEAGSIQVCWQDWEGFVLSQFGWCSDCKSIYTSFIEDKWHWGDNSRNWSCISRTNKTRF